VASAVVDWVEAAAESFVASDPLAVVLALVGAVVGVAGAPDPEASAVVVSEVGGSYVDADGHEVADDPDPIGGDAVGGEVLSVVVGASEVADEEPELVGGVSAVADGAVAEPESGSAGSVEVDALGLAEVAPLGVVVAVEPGAGGSRGNATGVFVA
jgi:hypothetical protein